MKAQIGRIMRGLGVPYSNTFIIDGRRLKVEVPQALVTIVGNSLNEKRPIGVDMTVCPIESRGARRGLHYVFTVRSGNHAFHDSATPKGLRGEERRKYNREFVIDCEEV